MVGEWERQFIPSGSQGGKSTARLDSPPTIIGGMVEFVCSDYATRERRTRVLIDPDDISSVKENYDLDQYQNNHWCNVYIKGTGGHYQVLSDYDSLVKLLVSIKGGKTSEA